MTRNNKGWLTAASLKAGEVEQYAVRRSYGTYVLELSWDAERECYLVSQTTKIDDDRATVVTPWHDADSARRQFRAAVRRHR